MLHPKNAIKFTKGLIAGSLALGLMVSGSYAEEPEVTISVPVEVIKGEVIDGGEPEVVICDIAIDEEEVVEIKDGEVPIEWVLRNNLGGDDLIFATAGGPLATAAAPAVTTDAGKDEAATVAKAAGVSTPAKSIASAGKRTSAVVKSGRVFLTH
jgi:hypothetical protein